MINVKMRFHKDRIQAISIKGHANSAAYGSDLVCAEVSAIGTGTLNAIDTLCPNSCNLIMDEGIIVIEVLEDSHPLQTILNVMYIQLQTVEYTNKKFIKIMKDEV